MALIISQLLTFSGARNKVALPLTFGSRRFITLYSNDVPRMRCAFCVGAKKE